MFAIREATTPNSISYRFDFVLCVIYGPSNICKCANRFANVRQPRRTFPNGFHTYGTRYIRWSRAAATRDWACRSLATPSRLASDPLTIHSSSSSSRFVAEQSTNSTQFNSLKAPLLLHIATTTHTNIHASSINSPLCCAKFDYNHSSGHILFKSMM